MVGYEYTEITADDLYLFLYYGITYKLQIKLVLIEQ